MKKLIILSFMLLFFAISAQAEQPTVEGLRVSATPGKLRLVFDITEPVNHEVIALHNPERIAIDLHAAKLQSSLPVIPKEVGFVENIRTGNPSAGVFRLVLDLKQPIRVEDFWLDPTDSAGHRLVLDLKSKPSYSYNKPTARPRPVAEEETQATDEENDYLVAFGKAKSAPTVVKHRTTYQNTAANTYKSYESANSTARRNYRDAPQVETRPYRVNTVNTANTVNTVNTRPSFPLNTNGRKLVVVIDPGHGGDDTGAIGLGGTREKDVVLAISKRLAKRINAQPGMRAVLTRDRDVFIPLRQRVVKSRQAKADLFVAIHADAAYNRNATGASVYTLSEKGASSSAARALADRENAYDLVSGVSLENKSSEAVKVVFDMTISAAMEASTQVAYDVLRYMSGIGDIHKDSVQYASFAVLKAHDVPSILVETAYISNVDEEQQLDSPAYQERIADAVFMGITDYFHARPPLGSMMAQTVKRPTVLGE